MLAFSVWNAIWVVFVAFLFINLLIVIFSVIGDLVRDHEVSGGAKALWMIGILFFPVIGLLAYLIIRGDGMAKRSAEANQAARESFDNYVRDVSGGAATELEKAKALHDSGALDDSEFAALKAKLLS